MTTDTIRVTDDMPPADRADILEARARRLMARNAEHQVRGWDGQRERDVRLGAIDAALDEFNEAARG